MPSLYRGARNGHAINVSKICIGAQSQDALDDIDIAVYAPRAHHITSPRLPFCPKVLESEPGDTLHVSTTVRHVPKPASIQLLVHPVQSIEMRVGTTLRRATSASRAESSHT